MKTVTEKECSQKLLKLSKHFGSQSNLAKVIGIDRGYLNHIIAGRKSITTAPKVIKFLKLKVVLIENI